MVSELEIERRRLDFILSECAFIVASETESGDKVYQLWTQDEDEYFISMSGNRFHKTPRDAIDAAIDTPEEKRTRVIG
jgi:hypothetical protein